MFRYNLLACQKRSVFRSSLVSRVNTSSISIGPSSHGGIGADCRWLYGGGRGGVSQMSRLLNLYSRILSRRYRKTNSHYA
jgi:hypothetical protein